MKKFAMTGLILFLISLVCPAQTRVEADNILEQINRGAAVRYENALVVGELKLIALDEMTEKHPEGKSTSWSDVRKRSRRLRFSDRSYWAHVKGSVTFVNCVFSGDVVAYEHNDKRRETYNVIFHDDVVFKDCEFKGLSAFKYCRFEEDADFSGNRYHEEALFKYAVFSSKMSFAGSNFDGYVNFKYTKFPDEVDFSGSRFKRDANFKYARFPYGVSFSNAVFQRDANFKYTKFSGDLNFDGTSFERGGNFKYTRRNGRRWSPLRY